LNFPPAVGQAPQDDRFAGLLRSIPQGSFRTAHDHLVSKHAAGLQEASLKNIAAALSRLGRTLDGLGTSLAGARPDQLTMALSLLRGEIADTSYELTIILVRSFYRW